MASVQYLVLYKYAHPFTKKAITNTTTGKYEGTNRFIKAYLPGAVNTAEILEQENSENPKYDMLFMYNGVFEINSFITSSVTAQHTVMSEKFERCKGEAWFMASLHTSLKSALRAAEPIAKAMGKANVRVVKNVPLDITVTME